MLSAHPVPTPLHLQIPQNSDFALWISNSLVSFSALWKEISRRAISSPEMGRGGIQRLENIPSFGNILSLPFI